MKIAKFFSTCKLADRSQKEKKAIFFFPYHERKEKKRKIQLGKNHVR